MIRLITGTPGSGKTAYALSLYLLGMRESRRIYVHGIPDLSLPHIRLKCDSPACEVCDFGDDYDGEVIPFYDWPNICEDGSIIYLDEAQYVYRARVSKRERDIPDWISALETHRHHGLDFILITQAPSFLDAHVLELVTVHQHITVTWMGRYIYEWSEATRQISRSSKAVAVKRQYQLPKDVFKLYTSATKHTKIKRRIPRSFLFMFLCIAFALFMGRYIYNRILSKGEPVPIVEKSQVNRGVGDDAVLHRESPDYELSGDDIELVLMDDFIPRDAGRLESASAYDGIRKVETMPINVGCIASGDRCICYTQQATVYPLLEVECRRYVDGLEFNPYLSSN